MLAVNVVQRSVGFGRGVFFCRWLEPEALGLWEMAYGFLVLAVPLAVLGVPGSFGRYLVKYQQRGQVGLFLRRTGSWTLALSASAIAVIVVFRERFAELVFGDADQQGLVLLTAGCLAVMILHHFLEAVFAGLKLFRVVSALHFCQSMVFAVTALTLVAYWRADAASLVVGYGAGCGVAVVGTLFWAVSRGRGEPVAPATEDTPSQRDFWAPLMRFAVGVWVANLLCNLFSVIDRYMILHFGGFDSETALAQIGNYHTACIVPLLLVSVANLLTGAMIPHLSHDWEVGHRDRVSERLNRALQLVAIAMLAAGTGVLLVCPWLFAWAFDAKYAAGLAVLPWTVASCVWFALMLVAQTYAWCAEKARAAAWPLAIGLAMNVVLNLAWLPNWGLAGAVAATAIATLLTLYAQLAINERLGMRTSPTTLALAASPLLLAGGVAPALGGLLLIAVIAGARLNTFRQAGGTPSEFLGFATPPEPSA